MNVFLVPVSTEHQRRENQSKGRGRCEASVSGDGTGSLIQNWTTDDPPQEQTKRGDLCRRTGTEIDTVDVVRT